MVCSILSMMSFSRILNCCCASLRAVSISSKVRFCLISAQVNHIVASQQRIQGIEYEVGIVQDRDGIVVFQNSLMYGPKTVVKHITVADDNQFEGFFHIFADDAGGNVFGVGIFFEMPENFGRMKVIVNDLRRKQLRYGTGLKQRNKINRGVFWGANMPAEVSIIF